MKRSKLDTPYIKQQVVKELALGKSQSAIGREIGISHSQVCRFASREDVKLLIEQETMSLLEAVPDAVENMKGLVRELPTLSMKDHKNRELSFRASKKVLESAGMLNTATQAPTVINIVNSNNSVFSPVVEAFFKDFFERLDKIDDGTKIDLEAE